MDDQLAAYQEREDAAYNDENRYYWRLKFHPRVATSHWSDDTDHTKSLIEGFALLMRDSVPPVAQGIRDLSTGEIVPTGKVISASNWLSLYADAIPY